MEAKQYLIEVFNQIAPILDEERPFLESIISRGRYRAKDYLLMAGDVCSNIFFITKGLVRYGITDRQGNEVSLKFRAENESITDFGSFLERQPSENFIEALEDVECLKIDRFGIDAIYQKVANGEKIGRKIAEGLFLESRKQVHSFYKNTPEERYLHLLTNNGQLVNRIPQIHIASHIGVRPQSLSRIKRRIVEQE
ncbi:MAG: Crp/Fnr family transcriptional regulator [Bacteroidota bacterium]